MRLAWLLAVLAGCGLTLDIAPDEDGGVDPTDADVGDAREDAHGDAEGGLRDAMVRDGDAVVPDARVEDADVPDARVEDADVPDANADIDASLSDADLPDVAIPDADLPDVALPDASIPDALITDASFPDVSIVDASFDAAPPDASMTFDAATPDASMTFDDCNGLDDDFDSDTDEDCIRCVRVGPGGTDVAPTSDRPFYVPFATINAAIRWVEGDAARPRSVCIGTTSCGIATRTTSMRIDGDGIAILGSRNASLAYTPCGANTTIVAAESASHTVNGDAVSIEHVVLTNGMTSISSSTLLEVNGSATLTDSALSYLPGAMTAGSAIHVEGAVTLVRTKVNVRSHSDAHAIDGAGDVTIIGCTGAACTDGCGSTEIGIHASSDTGAARGVDGGNVVIDAAAICVDGGSAAGVGVAAASSLNVQNATIEVTGAYATGVKVAGVVSSPPTIARTRVQVSATSTTTAIESSTSVEVVDSTLTASSTFGNVTGVQTSTGAVTDSVFRVSTDVASGNATGIECTTSCGSIQRNVIDVEGKRAIGVHENTNLVTAIIAQNVVSTGCTGTDRVAMDIAHQRGMIVNNVLRVTRLGCPAGTPATTRAIALSLSDPSYMVVHSNSLDASFPVAGGSACDGASLALVRTGMSVTIYDNELVQPACSAPIVVVDTLPADLANNHFEGANDVSTLMQYGAMAYKLVDLTFAGFEDNRIGNCLTAYPSLVPGAGTVCDDGGTMLGAPSVDIDGNPRDDGMPDIGAYELP